MTSLKKASRSGHRADRKELDKSRAGGSARAETVAVLPSQNPSPAGRSQQSSRLDPAAGTAGSSTSEAAPRHPGTADPHEPVG